MNLSSKISEGWIARYSKVFRLILLNKKAILSILTLKPIDTSINSILIWFALKFIFLSSWTVVNTHEIEQAQI